MHTVCEFLLRVFRRIQSVRTSSLYVSSLCRSILKLKVPSTIHWTPSSTRGSLRALRECAPLHNLLELFLQVCTYSIWWCRTTMIIESLPCRLKGAIFLKAEYVSSVWPASNQKHVFFFAELDKRYFRVWNTHAELADQKSHASVIFIEVLVWCFASWPKRSLKTSYIKRLKMFLMYFQMKLPAGCSARSRRYVTK